MKKKSIAVVILLLILTGIASFIYLRSRNDAPRGTLTVTCGAKTELVDPFRASPVSVKGTTVNNKGEKKDIDETGVTLSGVIALTAFEKETYTSARVVSSDEYAADVTADEISDPQKAFLLRQKSKDGNEEIRLIVFGDENSKRQIKDVTRIELQK
ncbi:MAG: hypothetical protein LIV11_01290 [Bacillota bacterium]|uniref:Oxidoreductase molybdopterin binding domain-containing protein n=1 Tax=[Clostridium] aminophilum TaxID=1526 RepID=A0A1I0A726_9FIRM|nr:hypothetical protein [[Clostridium] aminophilum]MDT3843204.1 hypothetical protein [Bacillota bacterium]SES89961.1 hypothetical protein SAMN04487771_1001114 [[Clostridium] aminophilum]